MKIAGREIGPGQSPYLIAEISGNHCGSQLNLTKLLVEANAAGADAVKLQAYTPDTITIDCDKPDFIVKSGPWKGRQLYELYKQCYTPWEWFRPFFYDAAVLGITAFASVFDRSSVDMLEKLGCPAYKIASMEITDTPLIKYAAATGKPLIISTGMASRDEIDAAVLAANGKCAILHCVSGYPADVESFNLQRLQRMDFIGYPGVEYGISDHTKGWEAPVAATALGASIIEKHIGMWENTSEDAAFSLNPDEFRQMCEAVRAIWKAMQPSEAKSEEPQRQLRRSLYVVEDMKAGEVFTEKNVRSIRPGYGMAPKELPNILGKMVILDIPKGTRLAREMYLE